jgi:hypothetical protein
MITVEEVPKLLLHAKASSNVICWQGVALAKKVGALCYIETSARLRINLVKSIEAAVDAVFEPLLGEAGDENHDKKKCSIM